MMSRMSGYTVLDGLESLSELVRDAGVESFAVV